MPRFWICKTNSFRRNIKENIYFVQMHSICALIHSGEYHLKPGFNLIREIEGWSGPNREALDKLRFDLKTGRAGISERKTHSVNDSILNHLLALRYFWVNFTKPVKNTSVIFHLKNQKKREKSFLSSFCPVFGPLRFFITFKFIIIVLLIFRIIFFCFHFNVNFFIYIYIYIYI